MKFKLTFSLAFMLLINHLTAQIRYTDEEIKNKYDHETIVLDLNGAEKNGFRMRFNYIFPSTDLKAEITKNGGVESNREYQKYRKDIGYYWLTTILGCIAIVLFASLLLTSATTANIASLLLLYMLLTLGTALAAVFFSKRAYRYLARAVWWYNRNILLKK